MPAVHRSVFWVTLVVALGATASCGGGEADGGDPLHIGSFPENPTQEANPVTSSGTAGGAGGAGGSGGASVGGGGAGGAPPCGSTKTCPTATALGIIAGDTGSDSKTASGDGSTFITVNVVEGDSGVVGAGMTLHAALTPPPGVDFDLYVYFDPDSQNLACGAPYTQSVKLGASVETIDLDWGEGAVPNGDDDTRNIVFEIRFASGTCAPTSEWSFLVQGNT